MTNSTTVSPLRQRMTEDMTARGLVQQTQRGHIRACKRFAAYLKRSPETVTAEDIVEVFERGAQPTHWPTPVFLRIDTS
jgi:hypothetical protein